MILRNELLDQNRRALQRCRIVIVNKPRQCGKTTMARQMVNEGTINYFDLENPVSLA